ncbi:sodium-dependent phosphate transport protein 2B-like [Mya arenaria]|uniref:sodium-dependent phosphate transport protein 2B-like n=1 Tax=Mya arenaria TaxID=6604 RepID=UPI0022E74796|nr:sodium-dependent phosphate transport protein 2B-like [Mya arenaria]
MDDDKKEITVTLEQDEVDIWALPELKEEYTPWKELDTAGRLKRVLLHYTIKILGLLAALYIFICSLSFLGDAFKLLGGKAAGKAFTNSELLSNPVAGLMLGVLATVLLQSSSTTTSIVVSMVGGGGLLSVPQAIPIVMGANIGTSVTNTIVAIGQITNKHDFRRAFAGATVHDMFNWMAVLVLLPVEVIVKAIFGKGWLEYISGKLVAAMEPETDDSHDQDYLKVITDPLVKLVIQLDKKVIQKIAHNELETNVSIIKHDVCGDDKHSKCTFMFEYGTHPLRGDSQMSDTAVGIILLFISLVLLCVCLVVIVKLLSSLFRGQIAHILRKFINAEFPGCAKYFTGYLAILIGAGMTVLVQSSSIFTSSITPLVGIGVLGLDRMYPLTLGSNIGTTATGILAAFAQKSNVHLAMQIAICHLLFNICGILIFYPLPFFRPPIAAAKFLGVRTSKYRWFAFVYLLFAFGLLPLAVFALSLASWIVLAAVLIPIALLMLIVFIIKLIQHKRPSLLPAKLRTWKWLPLPLRSLEPYDRVVMFIACGFRCCIALGCCKYAKEGKDELVDAKHGKQYQLNEDNEKKNGEINPVFVNGSTNDISTDSIHTRL